MPKLCHRFFTNQLDRNVHQIANDAVDFTADVADLGEFGCFDLDEGCFGESCEAARNFCLADAGRADHQYVLRRDLATQWFVYLHATPAIAQGYCDCALCVILADDMLVQFLDDFSGGHL